tara:strand:- start:198 stop:401 length:204 start_codon:yes stop_codon:yes gene_type:complete
MENDRHRQEVMTHLKYIKEKVNNCESHLERLNGRVRKNENDITMIRSIGVTLYALIGVALTWLGIKE